MKKILFIGFDYFRYKSSIAEELKDSKFSVDFFNIQPPLLYLKILRKLSTKRYEIALNRYHSKIIESVKTNTYDIVLFLQVHQFSIENIGVLKGHHSDSKFILYNWDSIKTHDYRQYINFFDSVFTFDPKDAKNLGIKYLPLFCIRPFQNISQEKVYDSSVYFIGNIVNPKRYAVLKAFKGYCKNNGISFNCYMSASISGYVDLIRAGFFPFDVKWFKISNKKFQYMIESSSAVFDFANHNKSGYTMRVIENLCAGKKLITNNTLIKKEAFYNEEHIFLYQNMNFNSIAEFIGSANSNKCLDVSEFYIQKFVFNLINS